MPRINSIIYAIAFQAGWFICVMAGNSISVTYAFTYLCLHFWLLNRFTQKLNIKKEIIWLLIIVCCGVAIETVFFSSGFLYTNTHNMTFGRVTFPPIWLISLWLVFAIAMRTSLAFLFTKTWLSCLLIVIAIPLNYKAGASLNNNIGINEPYIVSLGLIAVVWMTFLVYIIELKRHFFEDIFNDR
jgi:hypothetical protein